MGCSCCTAFSGRRQHAKTACKAVDFQTLKRQWSAPTPPCLTVMADRCATRLCSSFTSASRVVGRTSGAGPAAALNRPDMPKCTARRAGHARQVMSCPTRTRRCVRHAVPHHAGSLLPAVPLGAAGRSGPPWPAAHHRPRSRTGSCRAPRCAAEACHLWRRPLQSTQVCWFRHWTAGCKCACPTEAAWHSCAPSVNRALGDAATNFFFNSIFRCTCPTRWHWWPSTCRHQARWRNCVTKHGDLMHADHAR